MRAGGQSAESVATASGEAENAETGLDRFRGIPRIRPACEPAPRVPASPRKDEKSGDISTGVETHRR